jgi:hypothetical protein
MATTQKQAFLDDLKAVSTAFVEALANFGTLEEKATELELFSTAPEGPGLTDGEVGATFAGRTLNDVIAEFNSVTAIKKYGKNDADAPAKGFYLAAVHKLAR